MIEIENASGQKLKVNWPVLVVLVFFPLLVLFSCISYSMIYGCGKKELFMALAGYYGANISVGLGLHRLWSHGSYKTVKWVEFALMLMSSGTLQGPVLAWASDHRFHHAYPDSENDPHTPALHKSKLRGFLWAHLGWMLTGEATHKNIDRVTMNTLGRSAMLRWQLRNYWQIATFMNIVPPLVLGYLVGGNFQYALAGLLFIGIGRAIQQQATFSVNSVCHMLGSRKYANDSSGDIWWLFFALLGENWHNFHHAFGRDYRNGHKWYHLDIHKWLIAGLAKVGLAWDLVVTSSERIAAKQEEMRILRNSDYIDRLELIEKAAMSLADLAREKLAMVENSAKSALEMANDHIQKKLEEVDKTLYFLEKKSQALAVKARKLVNGRRFLSAKMVAKFNKNLDKLQQIALNAGVGYEDRTC